MLACPFVNNPIEGKLLGRLFCKIYKYVFPVFYDAYNCDRNFHVNSFEFLVSLGYNNQNWIVRNNFQKKEISLSQ